jgi:hypothetical protein
MFVLRRSGAADRYLGSPIMVFLRFKSVVCVMPLIRAVKWICSVATSISQPIRMDSSKLVLERAFVEKTCWIR